MEEDGFQWAAHLEALVQPLEASPYGLMSHGLNGSIDREDGRNSQVLVADAGVGVPTGGVLLGGLDEAEPGPGVVGGSVDDGLELVEAVGHEEGGVHLETALLGLVKGLGLLAFYVVTGLLVAGPSILALLKESFYFLF